MRPALNDALSLSRDLYLNLQDHFSGVDVVTRSERSGQKEPMKMEDHLNEVAGMSWQETG